MNQDLRSHILNFLEKGIRFDGRKSDEYRKIEVETGIISTAEGSARVKIGDSEVIAGVKMGMEKPFPDRPDEGMLMVNSELLPMAHPEFEAGPPDIHSIELARVTDRGIRESHAMDLKKLCVASGEKVWAVLVDICPINCDGNLFDAASLAAILAIKDARFPSLDENGAVDYKHRTENGLPILEEPLGVTVSRVGKHFIVDPTHEEEKLVDARLTVVTTKAGRICALQKGGSMGLTVEEISMIIDIASAKAKELRKYLG